MPSLKASLSYNVWISNPDCSTIAELLPLTWLNMLQNYGYPWYVTEPLQLFVMNASILGQIFNWILRWTAARVAIKRRVASSIVLNAELLPRVAREGGVDRTAFVHEEAATDGAVVPRSALTVVVDVGFRTPDDRRANCAELHGHKQADETSETPHLDETEERRADFFSFFVLRRRRMSSVPSTSRLGGFYTVCLSSEAKKSAN